MGVKNFFDGGKCILDTRDGTVLPLAGGQVFFYEPGSSTPKDVYTNSGLTTACPKNDDGAVELDTEGRANIWLSGNYKVIVKDADGVTIYTEDNINPDAGNSGSVGIGGNESFEEPSDLDSAPTGFTVSGGSVTRVSEADTAGVAIHGNVALKLTKDATYTTGGWIRSEIVEAVEGAPLHVDLRYMSSAAGVDNSVEISWLDKNQVEFSSDKILDDSAGNAPTEYTEKNLAGFAPVGTRYARIQFNGAEGTGDDGYTLLDYLVIRQDNGSIPAGVVMPFAGATAPGGWLLCEGQAVSRATYKRLFQAIGTAFGVGDGSTTFNIPDLRGRVAIGLDNMAEAGGSEGAANRVTASAADTRGGAGGSQDAVVVEHTHSYNDQTETGGQQVDIGGGGPTALAIPGTTAVSRTTQNANGGVSGAGKNMQPYIAMGYIIKA